MSNFSFNLRQKSSPKVFVRNPLLFKKYTAIQKPVNRTPERVYQLVHNEILNEEKQFLDIYRPILLMLDKQARIYNTTETDPTIIAGQTEAKKAIQAIKNNIMEIGKFKENHQYLTSIKETLSK
jgi:hypothetical protein